MAALPRKEAWTNAPVMDLSFKKISARIQMPENIRVVTIMQNRKYLRSKACFNGAPEISRNKRAGRAALKTNLLAVFTKFSLNHPFSFRNHPRKIIKKIGTVEFKLKIKSFISILRGRL